MPQTLLSVPAFKLNAFSNTERMYYPISHNAPVFSPIRDYCYGINMESLILDSNTAAFHGIILYDFDSKVPYVTYGINGFGQYFIAFQPNWDESKNVVEAENRELAYSEDYGRQRRNQSNRTNSIGLEVVDEMPAIIGFLQTRIISQNALPLSDVRLTFGLFSDPDVDFYVKSLKIYSSELFRDKSGFLRYK